MKKTKNQVRRRIKSRKIRKITTNKKIRQHKRKTRKIYGGLPNLRKFFFGKNKTEQLRNEYYKNTNSQPDQAVLSHLNSIEPQTPDNITKLCKDVNIENPESQFIHKSNIKFIPFYTYNEKSRYKLDDFINMFDNYKMNTNVNFGIKQNNLFNKSYTNLGYYLGYTQSDIKKHNKE